MTDDVRQALADIESQTFDFIAGEANDLTAFLYVIGRRPSVRYLIENADLELMESVLRHLVARVTSESDARYRNPLDAALATYLWILYWANQKVGKLAASEVLSAPRLYWSYRLARQILFQGESHKSLANSPVSTSLIRVGEPDRLSRTSPKSLEQMFVPNFLRRTPQLFASHPIRLVNAAVASTSASQETGPETAGPTLTAPNTSDQMVQQ